MNDRPPIASLSLADRPPVAGASPVDRPSIAAAVTNNVAKARWGAKTQQNRRCRDLFRSLMRLTGNPPEPAKQALCVSAAELMVLAEVARERSLKDPTPNNAEAAFKAEKAMRHALNDLGVKKAVVADDPTAESGGGLGWVDDDQDEQ
jgi:hypothetical protein